MKILHQSASVFLLLLRSVIHLKINGYLVNVTRPEWRVEIPWSEIPRAIHCDLENEVEI